MLDERRFKVKADAFYVRHDDGVWLRNNAGSFSVRGAGVYELVRSLFEHMDGERTVGQLCEGLPSGTRATVVRLVDALARNGLVKQIDYPDEDASESFRERFSAHLAFLDHHADRPVSRLRAVRSQLVACIGEGIALRALVGAAGELGIARLNVITTSAGAAGLRGLTAEASATDPQAQWVIHSAGERIDLAAAAHLPGLRDAAAVLIATDCGERRTVEAIATAQAALTGQGQAVGVLGRCGDFVVSAPPLAGSAGWCWECVWRRVSGRATGDVDGLPAAVAPATIAALHLAQHAFARLAGVRLDGADTLTSVEPLAPVVRRHAGRPHPLCRWHGVGTGTPAPAGTAPRTSEPCRPDLPASEDAPELVAVSDRIVEVTTGWTDRVFGPLLELGEADEPQLPLAASTCRVPDPIANGDLPGSRLVVCRALSPREARNQVVLFAVEWLAARTAGARPPAGWTAGKVAYGAGWSRAEAEYRALLTVSALAAADRADAVPSSDIGGGPVREFLAQTVRAAGPACVVSGARRLGTGFVVVDVRLGDGRLATGFGVDPDHALDNAMLAAAAEVAAMPAGAAPGAVIAHLAPPAPTWADALALVRGAATCGFELLEMPELVPFLGSDAHVCAVRLK